MVECLNRPISILQCDHRVSQELVEEAIILVANASPDPRAVMLHPHDAAAADRAVVAARRLEALARFAVAIPHEVAKRSPGWIVAEVLVYHSAQPLLPLTPLFFAIVLNALHLDGA